MREHEGWKASPLHSVDLQFHTTGIPVGVEILKKRKLGYEPASVAPGWQFNCIPGSREMHMTTYMEGAIRSRL